MKNQVRKWIATILLVIICALLSGLIESTPLLSRGIVIGFGLDKVGDEYEATVQLAVAGESTAPGAPNRYTVMSAKGVSVGKAMDEISRLSAFTPSYFHCHIVLFGEELVKSEAPKIAKDFLREDLLIDDCTVIAVQGSAKEVLELSVSVQGASALYLQQENKLSDIRGGHPAITLKEFVTMIETKGYSANLPFAVPIQVPKSSGGENKEETKDYAFDFTKSVIFDEQHNAYIEEKEITSALELTTNPEGMLLHLNTSDGDMDVMIKKTYRYWKVNKKGNISYCATYYIKLIAQTIKENPEELPQSFITDEVKKYIRDSINIGKEKAALSNVDLYSLRGKYIKKYGTKHVPQNIGFDTKLVVKITDG